MVPGWSVNRAPGREGRTQSDVRGDRERSHWEAEHYVIPAHTIKHTLPSALVGVVGNRGWKSLADRMSKPRPPRSLLTYPLL